MNRYYDPLLKCNAVKLLPGEYAVGTPGEVLVTLLGSCVAACVRDERRGIGGMNHFMLPVASEDLARSFDVDTIEFTQAGRYGVHAMELLINELLKTGSFRADLTCKVFGGGAVLGNMPTLDIGRANGLFVRHFLHTEGIPLLAEDLFGEWPRKVYFFPDSGKVRVNTLRTTKTATVLKREKDYASTLSAPAQEMVDLFT